MHSNNGGGGRHIGAEGLTPAIEQHFAGLRAGQRPAVPQSDASVNAVSAANGAPSEPEDGLVELSRAYQAHDVQVRHVRFRRPTTRDLVRCGYPVRQIINSDTGRVESLEMKPDAIAKYIPTLSDPPLPPSTVDQMTLEDFTACAQVICTYFLG
ncbi:MAG: phage tail assembly protein [Hyphomicrobiaceae bacterium]